MASAVFVRLRTIVGAIDERDQVPRRGIERGFGRFRPAPKRSSGRSTKGNRSCEGGSNVASAVFVRLRTIVGAIDERDQVPRRGIERGFGRFRPAPKRSSGRSTKGNRSCEEGSNVASVGSPGSETIVGAIDERDQVPRGGIERGFGRFRPAPKRSSGRSGKGIRSCEGGSNVTSGGSPGSETIVGAIDEREQVLRRGIERGFDGFARLRNDRRGDRRKGSGPAKADRT